MGHQEFPRTSSAIVPPIHEYDALGKATNHLFPESEPIGLSPATKTWKSCRVYDRLRLDRTQPCDDSLSMGSIRGDYLLLVRLLLMGLGLIDLRIVRLNPFQPANIPCPRGDWRTTVDRAPRRQRASVCKKQEVPHLFD